MNMAQQAEATVNELVTILGSSRASVERLIKARGIQPIGRKAGKGAPAIYAVPAIVAAYAETRADDGHSDELREWQIKKIRQQVEREAGKLVDVAERDAAEATRMITIRTRLLQVPGEAIRRGVHSRHEALLDALIRDALIELSETEG
jgi:hypothetical protein